MNRKFKAKILASCLILSEVFFPTGNFVPNCLAISPSLEYPDYGFMPDPPEHRRFMELVWHNDAEGVKELLEHTDPSKININDDFGVYGRGRLVYNGKILRGTALNVATQNDNLELVQTLLEHGAKYLCNEKHDTPIHLAVRSGNLKIAKCLLSEYLVSNNNQRYVSGEGYREEKADEAEYWEHYLNAKGYFEETPLYIAVRNKDIDMIKLILDTASQHMDIKCLFTKCSYVFNGNTPLHRAVEDGSDEIASLLLERGAECAIDVHDEGGRLPLYTALSPSANINMVRLLLKFGAARGVLDRYKPCEKFAPFAYVFTSSMARLLLENCDYIDASSGGVRRSYIDCTADISRETTVLNTIVSLNDYDIFKLLVEKCGEKNVSDAVNMRAADKRTTALHIAARNGNMKIVKWLVDHNAHPMAEDDYGRTAIEVAKDPDIRRLLEKHAETIGATRIRYLEILHGKNVK